MTIVKKHIILALILILSVSNLIGQETKETSKYYKKMKSSLYTLYKAGNYETYNMMARQIRKIAEEEETKWIPYYHSAYGYIMKAYLAKEKYDIEESLNQAQLMLDKAKELYPGSDEISALQGFLYQARIKFDPRHRSIEYTRKAMKEYDHARFLNKNNPRPYYLIGQLLYRMPEQIGGNKENACKHFKQAQEKFKAFTPKSEFSPNWGEQANEIMLNKCKK